MALFKAFSRMNLRPSLPRTFSRSLIINPGEYKGDIKTVFEVIEELSMSVIGGPTTYDPKEYNQRRQKLLEYVPSSQDELPPRKMMDSFDSALIPLGSNKKIRDRYSTHLGGVRIGRLLEDMDIFAVHLVFKHTLIPTLPQDTKQSPFSIVTALVDRIFVHGNLATDQDIRMVG